MGRNIESQTCILYPITQVPPFIRLLPSLLGSVIWTRLLNVLSFVFIGSSVCDCAVCGFRNMTLFLWNGWRRNNCRPGTRKWLSHWGHTDNFSAPLWNSLYCNYHSAKKQLFCVLVNYFCDENGQFGAKLALASVCVWTIIFRLHLGVHWHHWIIETPSTRLMPKFRVN